MTTTRTPAQTTAAPTYHRAPRLALPGMKRIALALAALVAFAAALALAGPADASPHGGGTGVHWVAKHHHGHRHHGHHRHHGIRHASQHVDLNLGGGYIPGSHHLNALPGHKHLRHASHGVALVLHSSQHLNTLPGAR